MFEQYQGSPRRLFSLDRILEECLVPFLWLLDVPLEDAAWAHLDPPVRRQRLQDAIRRVLFRESQIQPVGIVFEDLHWIDGETQLLLDLPVERLATSRVLLLVTYRPEYTHAWGSKTYYTRLRLDALLSSAAT